MQKKHCSIRTFLSSFLISVSVVACSGIQKKSELQPLSPLASSQSVEYDKLPPVAHSQRAVTRSIASEKEKDNGDSKKPKPKPVKVKVKFRVLK